MNAIGSSGLSGGTGGRWRSRSKFRHTRHHRRRRSSHKPGDRHRSSHDCRLHTLAISTPSFHIVGSLILIHSRKKYQILSDSAHSSPELPVVSSGKLRAMLKPAIRASFRSQKTIKFFLIRLTAPRSSPWSAPVSSGNNLIFLLPERQLPSQARSHFHNALQLATSREVSRAWRVSSARASCRNRC